MLKNSIVLQGNKVFLSLVEQAGRGQRRQEVGEEGWGQIEEAGGGQRRLGAHRGGRRRAEEDRGGCMRVEEDRESGTKGAGGGQRRTNEAVRGQRGKEGRGGWRT